MTDNPVTTSISKEAFFKEVLSLLAEKHKQLTQQETMELMQAVEGGVPAIVAQNAELAQDETSRSYVIFCSTLLSLYRALGAHLEDRLVKVDILRVAMARVFGSGIHAYIKGRFDVDVEKPNEAFDKISANFRVRGEAQFGQNFEYDEERNGDDEVTFGVKHCLFKNFFTKSDAAELLPLFCAMDAVWSQEINTGDYNIRFDRPTIMSIGDDKCRFRFRRSEAN